MAICGPDPPDKGAPSVSELGCSLQPKWKMKHRCLPLGPGGYLGGAPDMLNCYKILQLLQFHGHYCQKSCDRCRMCIQAHTCQGRVQTSLASWQLLLKVAATKAWDMKLDAFLSTGLLTTRQSYWQLCGPFLVSIRPVHLRCNFEFRTLNTVLTVITLCSATNHGRPKSRCHVVRRCHHTPHYTTLTTMYLDLDYFFFHHTNQVLANNHISASKKWNGMEWNGCNWRWVSCKPLKSMPLGKSWGLWGGKVFMMPSSSGIARTTPYHIQYIP